MSEEELTTRQRILEAAISGIETYGLDQLTIRKIAKDADANIASINYHFRTKADLVAEALTMTINHMLEDVRATLDQDGRPVEKTLEEVFFYLLDGGRRFPGITTAHMYRAVVKKEYESPGGKAIRQAFDRTVQRVQDACPDKDPEWVRFVLSQIFSALMFSLLTPDFFTVSDRYLPEDSDRCRLLARSYAGWVGQVLETSQRH
jgi:TetR/AcrR family transcriptional regulator, regulator of cefoperazone and chloramphenicol sensitivity